MVDDTRSGELTLPEDEPWMSHGFISKIAAQVSLPYRRPKDNAREIVRRNGNLVVRFICLTVSIRAYSSCGRAR